PGASVTLTDYDTHGEDKVLAAICYPFTNLSDGELADKVAALAAESRRSLMDAYVGERRNRRHRPGRAFERTGYRFDIVTDYGAFRDLQRHRLLTIEWQPLSTELGYEVPDLVVEAGLAERYGESLERSRALHDALEPLFPALCGYTVALGYNIRFAMQLNAREAMHVIELRSTPQGHPTYRRVVQEMHRLIGEQAGHRLIAGAMCFVEHDDASLGRLESESRAAAGDLPAAGDLAAGDLPAASGAPLQSLPVDPGPELGGEVSGGL
ncbi:MAG: FAD-dependent thymidylate synthase, partial [Acidimicrobiales bacterium]